MKFFSIKDRLIMVLMITSVTSLVIASLAFSFYELQRYKKFKTDELVQVVDLLGPQSLQYLMANDLQKAESWLSILSKRKNVREAALYDAQGILFADYQRDLTINAPPLSIHDIQEECFADSICSSLQGLYQGDTRQGFFFLAVDLDDAREGFISILVIFFFVAMVTLGVVYVSAFLLHDQFKKPIVSLVETARFICEKKDFKARARKYSSDEMGLLTDTINDMLDEISKREEEMKDLTGQLESRVETRTAALKEINARLFSEKTRADHAATVKSDFLANMSHEIRTPMNGIVAACDLAIEEDISPKVANYLKIIQDSSHALLLIINDILDFSRLEAGTLVLHHSLFSLPELLAELNEFFSVKAQDENIDLIVDMDPEVPVLLIGDRSRFRQILYNLVDNGIKFTHDGMVSLYVACLEKNDTEATLEILVRDTGVGLSPEGKERIFNSFHQEDSSSTRQFGGTGLGLAISRKLARMMGGTIKVESELGNGSIFITTVRLGWKQGAIDEPALPFSKERSGSGQGVDLSSRGLHVLVVEDNETNRGVTEAMLTGMGITVESVVNGKEAVDITRNGLYDAILMDMQMPVMDGYQAMQLIRKEGACRNVPIVAMTAYALTEDKAKCLEAGADAYISKPVYKKRLQDVLCTIFQDQGLGVDEDGRDDFFDDLETGAEFIVESRVIDVEKAIRQLGVRADVYHRVLKTFCADYESFRDDYITASRNNDVVKIQKMVHSLKGSSATVGAEALSQLAIEADRICKNKEMPPDALAMKLLNCLDEVLAYAHTLEKPEGESSVEHDHLTVKNQAKVLQQLQDLADSLDQSLYDTINLCLERFEENVSGKRVMSLSKMIRMYSYESALALVQEIARELGLSLRE
ncbi:MAG: response regulator [Proteobacteria bacterium]|nr:response regulator [Pseudomonadota bacterium]